MKLFFDLLFYSGETKPFLKQGRKSVPLILGLEKKICLPLASFKKSCARAGKVHSPNAKAIDLS